MGAWVGVIEFRASRAVTMALPPCTKSFGGCCLSVARYGYRARLNRNHVVAHPGKELLPAFFAHPSIANTSGSSGFAFRLYRVIYDAASSPTSTPGPRPRPASGSGSGSGTTTTAPSAALPRLTNKGYKACNQSYPCGLCVGDCDKNSDCGVGLTCFKREGAGGSIVVPGCSSGSMAKNIDYCTNGTVAPTTAPTPSRAPTLSVETCADDSARRPPGPGPGPSPAPGPLPPAPWPWPTRRSSVCISGCFGTLAKHRLVDALDASLARSPLGRQTCACLHPPGGPLDPTWVPAL